MRSWFTSSLSALLFLIPAACAQEPIPPDEALKAAKLLAEKSQKLDDAPFSPKLDIEKSVGLKAGDFGALLIPAAELKADDLAKVTDKPLPIAQLWLRQLVPFIDGSPVADTDLRKFDIKLDDRNLSLPLLLLGVVKNAGGKFELQVYSKGTKPALTLPLEKLDDAAVNETNPVTIDGRDNGDGTGAVIIRILGKYEATVTLIPDED